MLGAGILLAGPSAQPAHACSCMAVTDEDAFAAADVVFRGQLAGYEPPPLQAYMSSADPAVWTFAVSQVHKGDVAPSQQIVSPVSGASCGLELPHQGEFLVFATRRSFDGPVSDGRYHANLCGGTRSTAAGPLALQVPPAAEAVTTVAPETSATTVATTAAPSPSTSVPTVIESQALTQAPGTEILASPAAAATTGDGDGGGGGALAVPAIIGSLLALAAVGVVRRRRANAG